jgi:hypothetical protein
MIALDPKPIINFIDLIEVFKKYNLNKAEVVEEHPARINISYPKFSRDDQMRYYIEENKPIGIQYIYHPLPWYKCWFKGYKLYFAWSGRGIRT